MVVTRDRYSTIAIILHWLIAALILTNIGVAWYFNTLPRLAQIGPVQLHKSIGITILLLSLARVGWRLANPPPPLPRPDTAQLDGPVAPRDAGSGRPTKKDRRNTDRLREDDE